LPITSHLSGSLWCDQRYCARHVRAKYVASPTPSYVRPVSTLFPTPPPADLPLMSERNLYNESHWPVVVTSSVPVVIRMDEDESLSRQVALVIVQPLTRRAGCAVVAADRYWATRGEHVVRVFCCSGHEGGGRRLAQPGKPYNCVWVGGGGCSRQARGSWVRVFRVDGTTPAPSKRWGCEKLVGGVVKRATCSEADGTSLTVRSATTVVGR
jgi:hypothetical protein